jgi:hypothetical protein
MLKKSYYINLLEKHKQNSKHTWEIVREITGSKKSKTNSLPNALKINDEIIYDQRLLADKMNTYFISVGKNLSKIIRLEPKTNITFDFPLVSCLDSFKLSFDEFDKAFQMLKSNKAIGHDDISGNVVINSYETIKDVLYKVFKCSIDQGIFPDQLKIAKVTPIFKGGELLNVGNYRPISVLSVFSKILERILYNKIFQHLSTNNILYKNQYGFKKNNSTEHAILHITQCITDSFEKSKFTLGIFVDLSKAFDTIDHKILFKKLKHYGIKGNFLKLIKSYLSNRKQFVHFDQSSRSKLLEITCGVPQGSVLGPLLFLIYINDLYEASNLMTIMFADDTNFFLSHSNITTLFSCMDIELNKVSQWFKSNKLSLNIEKTKWSLFHSNSKKRLIPIELPLLFIDGVLIERVTCTKFLGVLIDENLTWKKHIGNISCKISKSIGILYKARNMLNKHILTQLYHSFIHCHLNYANAAWGSVNKSKLEPLHRQQKHAIRLINFKDRFAHTKLLFIEMNILNIFQLNVFNVLCFMFKCKNRTAPVSFHNLYSSKEKNKYNLRNDNSILQPVFKTNLGKFCISFRGAFLWNNIVLKHFDFSQNWNFFAFKRKLKNIILSTENILVYF